MPVLVRGGAVFGSGGGVHAAVRMGVGVHSVHVVVHGTQPRSGPFADHAGSIHGSTLDAPPGTADR